MAPDPVLRIVASREDDDCAITAMAMISGCSYEDVLREVVVVDPRHRGKRGLQDRQIRKVMARLDCPVRFKKTVDFDEDYGLLRLLDHLCVLRSGLVIEDDTIWDVDVWLKHKGYDLDLAVCGIFVER